MCGGRLPDEQSQLADVLTQPRGVGLAHDPVDERRSEDVLDAPAHDELVGRLLEAGLDVEERLVHRVEVGQAHLGPCWCGGEQRRDQQVRGEARDDADHGGLARRW